jgi:hypothetical protein
MDNLGLGRIPAFRVLPVRLPNRASKLGPTRGLGLSAKFPLWLPAGPACRQSAAIPTLSIALEDTSDRPAQVGVELPCGVPTKESPKKVQRRKLNETGVRYRFLLRALFLFGRRRYVLRKVGSLLCL